MANKLLEITYAIIYATYIFLMNCYYSRFGGKFHRRSVRRGSKYKMQHRSPTELSRVKKMRRAKANDRERTRMQTLNQALEKLRTVLPAFPDETKLTKIETLKFANNYIYALKESINSMDTGKPANLPMTGWEGMLTGPRDQLQHCAILAQSLMSHQFSSGQGLSPPQVDQGYGQVRPGYPAGCDQAFSPVKHQLYPHDDQGFSPVRGQHSDQGFSPVRGQRSDQGFSPVRGQHQHPHHSHQTPHQQYPLDPGLSPGQVHEMYQSYSAFSSPVKGPTSPPQLIPHHPISPPQLVPRPQPHQPTSPTRNCVSPAVLDYASPHKPQTFLDNNPGFCGGGGGVDGVAGGAPGVGVASPAVWSPHLAIHPTQPTFDECYSQPPQTSSLYGQDLRYGYGYQ